MTNKERYKQAFSVLQSSDEINLETTQKAYAYRKKKLYQMAASFAACLLLVAASVTAYAADLGGIKSMIKLWIQGEQTDVTISFEDGRYTMEYVDSEGIRHHQEGGGYMIEEDGSERPLTKSELMDEINAPDVVYGDDGSVWVYYFDKKINITDKFHDNVCYVTITGGNKTWYMTIKYQGSYAVSPDEYMSASMLD